MMTRAERDSCGNEFEREAVLALWRYCHVRVFRRIGLHTVHLNNSTTVQLPDLWGHGDLLGYRGALDVEVKGYLSGATLLRLTGRHNFGFPKAQMNDYRLKEWATGVPTLLMCCDAPRGWYAQWFHQLGRGTEGPIPGKQQVFYERTHEIPWLGGRLRA